MEFPQMGIGTYKLTTQDQIDVVLKSALQTGYKMIDTAELYKNQELIGNFLKREKIERKQVWITSKVSFRNMMKTMTDVKEGIQKTFDNLKTEYIDLYLLHSPVEKKENMLLTWYYLRELQKIKMIRYIGISNFPLQKLKEFIELIGEEESKNIFCNQIECNPYHNRQELIQYCKQKNIKIIAYGSLYKITQPVIDISKKIRRTPQQILLKWAIQNDIHVIPMAENEDYIKQNVDLNFEISEEDMGILNNLNENYTQWRRYN